MKKYVISDIRIPKKAEEALKSRSFEVIKLPPFKKLDPAVASHPDMLMFLGDKILCHKDYYLDNSTLIDNISHLSGLYIELSDESIEKNYPNDILFNALPLGQYVFCKESAISRLVKDHASRNGLTVVNTRQGYARCSVCKISEGAVISSDASLLSAIAAKGFDTLCISEGSVRLEPYDHGFIGGASGAFGDEVFFCGKLDLHPDAEKIKEFCKKHQKNAVSLSDEEMVDVGTLFFFSSEE